MSVTTGQQLKDLGGGLFSAVSSAEKTRVNAALVRRSLAWNAGLAANTALVESVVFTVPANLTNGIRIKAITLSCTTGIDLDGTNYRVFTVKKYDAAGANGATVSTLTTLTGGTALTALVPTSMTLTDANAVVVAGACVTLTITDAGTAPIFDGSVTIDYEEL